MGNKLVLFGSLAAAATLFSGCSSSSLTTAESSSRFCLAATGYNSASGALDNLPAKPTPDQLRMALEESLDELKSLTKVAPPAIKPDLQNVVKSLKSLLGIAARYGYEFAKIDPKDPEFLIFVADTTTKRSGDAVSAYLLSTCGFGNNIGTTVPA